MKPVVIVGAGLAGLTCARALKRRRVPFLIVEAGDRIGGRVRTDTVGDMHLDRGYQVYFTAYPHAKESLDVEKLNLKPFHAGAMVIWDGDQNIVSRDKPLQFAISSYLGIGDKIRLGKWTSDVQWLDQSDIDEIPDRSSEQYLRDQGFSESALDRFFRPFLSGVFLDRSLSTSCRQLLFVWKALSEGETAVPLLGMEEIPKQIGMTFGHDTLRLQSRVAELVILGGQAVGVKLESGDEIEAAQVVLACDSANAAKLSGIAIDCEFRSSITLYFTAAESPMDAGWLALNGNARGLTNHIVVMPNAGSRTNLLCATILGERQETDEQLADIVKAEMRIWFPSHDAETWKLLRCYRSPQAQMSQPVGFQNQRPANQSGVPGLFFAGEFTTNSSIDGAIQSGLECAEEISSQVEAGAA